MKSIEHKFVNELGNPITLSGVLTDTTVTLKIEGPESTSTNTLTHGEGRMLSILLLNLFPETLPEDDEEEG